MTQETTQQRQRPPAHIVALALRNPGTPVELVTPLEEMAAVGWAMTTGTTFTHGLTRNGTRVFIAWESDEARNADLRGED